MILFEGRINMIGQIISRSDSSHSADVSRPSSSIVRQFHFDKRSIDPFYPSIYTALLSVRTVLSLSSSLINRPYFGIQCV